MHFHAYTFLLLASHVTQQEKLYLCTERGISNNFLRVRFAAEFMFCECMQKGFYCQFAGVKNRKADTGAGAAQEKQNSEKKTRVSSRVVRVNNIEKYVLDLLKPWTVEVYDGKIWTLNWIMNTVVVAWTCSSCVSTNNLRNVLKLKCTSLPVLISAKQTLGNNIFNTNNWVRCFKSCTTMNF